MAAIFLVLIGGYFALDATHHTVLAYTCLAHALLLLHPVRALVLFCLAAVGTSLIGLLNLVIPGRRQDDPVPPAVGVRPAPAARPAAIPLAAAPAAPVPAEPVVSRPADPVAPARSSAFAAPSPEPAQTWQGQASPFLDRRGRHVDNRP